ncbi:MAG: AAA family ATPase [PVC group bacterium]|nr:AAA family ATPase [PVC group bacterium]
MKKLLIFEKIRIFFSDFWMILTIVATLSLLIAAAVVFIGKMEYYGRVTLFAHMSLFAIVVLISGVFSALVYIALFSNSFGKSNKDKHLNVKDLKIPFSSVIGIDEAKQEALELVQLLRDRTLIKKIGGKVLRGILMVGPPGCGKTYLAKAIATEAGIPFLSMAGSEFVEIFVGVGAQRIRKVFNKAKRYARFEGACIIFIDEIDAVGRSRSFSFMGGQETNNTLNQLLVEMDGLSSKEQNVIVVAATNAEESVLDAALLRPGRFDRKIYIDRPNLEGREQLFEFYLSKVRCDETIDVGRLARKAVYKTPADIENIIKEAALIATRKKKEDIGYKEISEAMERIELGIKHKRKMTKHEREMTAYHESGHLVSLYILHPTDDVFKASIISRRNTLGVVYHQPREEIFCEDRDHLLADIKVGLAGYVAEKLRFGVTSNGVTSDFQQAMRVAHMMVWRFGMGISETLGDYTAIPKSQLSESVKQRLNEETNQILQECLKDVEDLLKKERQILDRFAKELLEKDELEYDDIEAIFKEYGKTSIRNENS